MSLDEMEGDRAARGARTSCCPRRRSIMPRRICSVGGILLVATGLALTLDLLWADFDLFALNLVAVDLARMDLVLFDF